MPGNEIEIDWFLKITGVSEGTNPEAVKLFESEGACAPTAHRLLGLAEGVGKAEAFVGSIIKLLIVTMLLLSATLTRKERESETEPPK